MRGTIPLHNLGLLFEEAARQHSDAPAIRCEDGTEVSYSALDALANRTAQLLLDQGCRRGDVICIVHSKTPPTYAVMLACLKIGAAYANVDSSNPAERLGHVFSTARPRCLVTCGCPGQAVLAAAREHGLEIIDLEQRADEVARESPETLPGTGNVTGTTPAYLMFTSGSTGVPKGVVITHSNVIGFIRWAADCYDITSGDVLTGVNPPYFDNSVFDFYASLFNGACLAPIRRETVEDPGALIDAVERAHCTIWFSVPSLLIYLGSVKLMKASRMPELRVITFGGEGYPKSELIKLWRAFGERIRIVNVYGPTECTCICSAYDIGEDVFGDLDGLPPLGELAPNFDGLLLDGDTPVEVGRTGELCLAGPGVAAGYYRMPERSAESFVQNPLHDAYRDPVYRTGDLVRRSPEDGLLYFVGRIDNQVKHMGYRIELEEIEAALAALDEVVEAAVVYRRVRATHGHILAFVAGSRVPGEYELQQRLREHLPSYMIPNRVYKRSVLPKNANGKIDRAALRHEAEAGAPA